MPSFWKKEEMVMSKRNPFKHLCVSIALSVSTVLHAGRADAKEAEASTRPGDNPVMRELTFENTRDFFAKVMAFQSTKVNSQGYCDTYPQGKNKHEWVMRLMVPMASWLSRPGRATTFTHNGMTVDVAESLRKALENGSKAWVRASRPGVQMVVEAPQAGYAAWICYQAKLAGAPGGAVWDSLTATNRAILNDFLAGNAKESFVYKSNWNLFLVVNHEARKQLNLAGFPEFTYDQAVIDGRLKIVQGLHHGGGWYSDWDEVKIFDDYVPFALLPDQMAYFHMGGNLPQAQTVIPDTNGRGRAQILADASQWLKYQVRTFDSRGGNPEYGRSSTYKFARLRTLVTAYYLDRVWNTPDRWNLGFRILPEEITPGMLRRLIRLHLNHYLANGTIDPVTFEIKDGQTLESGPEIIDPYINKGSNFWSMFPIGVLFLLPDNDPIWSVAEEKLPSERAAYADWYETPGFLVRNNLVQGHLELFPARNHIHSWMIDQYPNAYTKFAYSSRFGYCTKSGTRLDQCVMVGENFRGNPASANYVRQPGVLRTTHNQQGGAKVKTLIFFKDGAQVRVHRITGAAGQRVRDGGYALGHTASETPPAATVGSDWTYLESSNGAQLVARLAGYTGVSTLAGTGNHSRFANWRVPYASIESAAGDSFDCAMLIQASTARLDPAAARALVAHFAIQGNTATVIWSDGTKSAAEFE